MKKQIIIPIMLGLFLSSCGTATKYASVTFDDAVYEKPGSNKYVVVNTQHEEELAQLREKTEQSEQVIVNGRVVEPLYADENGNVEVNIDEEKTYIILNPGESFEERLKKFDSPDYIINITYNPRWEWYYNPWNYSFSPYVGRAFKRMMWHSRFYGFMINPWSFGSYYFPNSYFTIDPFLGIDYSLYSYMNYYTYSPWHYYYPYRSYYFDDLAWYYYYHSSRYRYGFIQDRRPYYGDRRDPNRGAVRTISGESNLGSTSMRRSTARVEQIRGENVYRGSESIYRRENRSVEGLGTNTGSTRTSGEYQRRGATEVNRTASTGTVRRTNPDINRGASEVNRNNNQGAVRRANTELDRNRYEGPVRRTNSEIIREGYEGRSGNSNSQINRGNARENNSTRQSAVTGRNTNTSRNSNSGSGIIQSRNYRPSAVQTQRSSSRTSNYSQPSRSSNNYGTVNRSSSYSPPARSSSSSNTSSSSGSSSGSSSSSNSSSSSSGSGYRR